MTTDQNQPQETISQQRAENMLELSKMTDAERLASMLGMEIVKDQATGESLVRVSKQEEKI
mgnify:CR=1 FL=1